MPEGDTLRQAEQRIAPLLEGRRLERVWFRRGLALSPRPGQLVESVRAVGKHLLIELDREPHPRHASRAWPDGGRRCRPSRTPQPGTEAAHRADRRRRARALLRRAHDPHVRTRRRPDAGRPPRPRSQRRGAGPRRRCSARIDRFAAPDRPVADVLLDQRIAAGVGNVFKSEALFVGGHPSAHADRRARRRRPDVASGRPRTASSAPTRGPGPRRTTVTNHGLAVYGRHHGGCPRCDGAIEYAPAGPGASTRSSYWCPVCQPAPS